MKIKPVKVKPVKAWAIPSMEGQIESERVYASKVRAEYYAGFNRKVIPVLITPITRRPHAKRKTK